MSDLTGAGGIPSSNRIKPPASRLLPEEPLEAVSSVGSDVSTELKHDLAQSFWLI